MIENFSIELAGDGAAEVPVELAIDAATPRSANAMAMINHDARPAARTPDFPKIRKDTECS